MLQQGLALELDQYVDGKNAGIDEVAENEIDNAVAAAKRHRRLCPFLGERIEPGPLPPASTKARTRTCMRIHCGSMEIHCARLCTQEYRNGTPKIFIASIKERKPAPSGNFAQWPRPVTSYRCARTSRHAGIPPSPAVPAPAAQWRLPRF